jgi:Peptidase family M28/PDZ domain/PA domain
MLARALAVVALAVAVASDASGPSIPPAEWLLDQVKALSAPDMEGRASGAPGGDRAARHIAGVFRQAGLIPGGDAGTYLEAFQVPTGIRLGTANALTIVAPALRALALGRDFSPLAVSEDGAATAMVVFAGYGITAPDLQYDDYAGLDVRGKIALVLTGEPRGGDSASPFRRPDASHYSEWSHKIINAREHGARGVLLVSHPGAGAEALPELRRISPPWAILAAAVTRATGDALLAPAGKRLAEAAEAIDGALAPRSFAIPGVAATLEVSLIREQGSAANVIGILRGTDATLRDEAVVIGAHYDHLGHGGEGSLAPDARGAIHPGADDNASGTAAVMGLARAFAAAGGAPRTLVFAAFAGEEMGLLGSSEYVRRPAAPLARTVFMLNLDMVGRLRGGTLHVDGVDGGTGLRALVTDAARGLGLTLELHGDPYAGSDHTSFYAAGRPVLFLSTGAHEDYHRPTDTWDKLNSAGLETVTTFAARVVSAISAASAPPQYVKVESAAGAGQRGGYGPYFGVIPDFGGGITPGVRIIAVRAGSPAEKAGVLTGDTMIGFGGHAVKTLEDLVFVLRGKRAGDRVEVVVLRAGQERRAEAVLEERR